MTSNAATKKAARALQAQSGIPYAQALRLSQETDWTIEMGQTKTGQTPYPFIATRAGETYGFIDYGTLVGFQRDPEQYTIDLYWPDAQQDPAQAVGMYPVTSDRFSYTLSTWTAPVRSIKPSAPRAERTEAMGGVLPETDKTLLDRVEVRALRNRNSESEAPAVRFYFNGPGEDEECEGEIEPNGFVEMDTPDDNDESLRGIVEHFLDDEGNDALSLDEFLENPGRAIGLKPAVWVSDVKMILPCTITALD